MPIPLVGEAAPETTCRVLKDFIPRPPKLLRPVKMVVWDLDDTFWTGTLSEGVVALHESRVATVR